MCRQISALPALTLVAPHPDPQSPSSLLQGHILEEALTLSHIHFLSPCNYFCPIKRTLAMKCQKYIFEKVVKMLNAATVKTEKMSIRLINYDNFK